MRELTVRVYLAGQCLACAQEARTCAPVGRQSPDEASTGWLDQDRSWSPLCDRLSSCGKRLGNATATKEGCRTPPGTPGIAVSESSRAGALLVPTGALGAGAWPIHAARAGYKRVTRHCPAFSPLENIHQVETAVSSRCMSTCRTPATSRPRFESSARSCPTFMPLTA